ncbi:MAG TPA: flagellar hook-associated protein FlgK [Rhizomicrobium sp.]|nr:flagellar hook-associated protein FlgK [Rhizomicrobium sp.]
MSLNGIAASALSALQTNSTALRVVSNNVANLNTVGYARRVVNETAQASGGTLTGVDISDIQRISDQFLQTEQLSASGSSARYDTQSSVFDQLNSLLGQPGDPTSLTSQLGDVSTALGQAALAPTDSANQIGALNSFQDLASTFSNLASQISGLRGQVDQQVSNAITNVNSLVKQVYDLNTQIKTAQINGDTASALLDQRDVALNSLSAQVGIRTIQQPDGSMSVMTDDGVNLVGDSYAQLSYTPGANNGTYGSIMSQDVNPNSGQPIGQPQNFEPHLSGGSLKGMLDMRDGTLADLGEEVGNLAQQTAAAYNEQHNANTSFPPPTTLSGRNTGLVASDALNFTGNTTVAVSDSSGNLVSRIDVNFGTGQMTVDGGAPISFANTVGGFTTALNGALGSNGTASFANGQLSISAGGTNGIVVQDNASNPADRGGSGFSQFFGLGDLFTSAAPSIKATGLSASDAGNFAAGGQISLQLKGPNGEIAKTATVTLTAGMTIGNVVSALNTAMGGSATFTLNSDGSITEAQPSSLSTYTLNVTNDTTQRGTTGMSATQLFGIGANQMVLQASSFAVSGAIANAPQNLAFAQAQITPTTTAGDTVVGHGDNSGAVALENVGSNTQSFAKAGEMAAQTGALSDYAAAFYQDVATQSSTATANQTAQDDRLTEAQSRTAANSGVNLDEELSNMMTYQQAYSAGARMLTVVDQLYDTLLQIQ